MHSRSQINEAELYFPLMSFNDGKGIIFSACGIAQKKFAFPQAEIRSRTDIPALRNGNKKCAVPLKVVKLRCADSFFRKRKCTFFYASPQAEIRSGPCSSASRNCKRIFAVPRAVLQNYLFKKIVPPLLHILTNRD